MKKKYKKNKEGKWVKMSEPRLIFDMTYDFKEMPDGKYKSTIPVARVGKWKHPEYGEFEISSKDLNEIEANFGTVRESQPPINYEHGEGVDASIGAAGWVQNITRNDGRLEGEVYWTKEAWDKIQNGAFKYISPEIRFHYKDKEDGKDQGTVLVGAALTTKPWIEDLAIVLSEKIFAETHNELAPLADVLNLQETDRLSIQKALDEFLAKYDIDLPSLQEQLKVLRTILDTLHSASYLSENQINDAIEAVQEIQAKEWTRAFINDLPDSSFAYIESGGEKDGEGKTKPRSLRHFPYKDKNGKIDLPHLRNALARAPQSPFGDKAMSKLKTAAKQAKVGEYGKTKKGGEQEMDIKTLIEKLNLNEEDATEETVISAIDELIQKANVDLTQLLTELSMAETASMDEILAKVQELKSTSKNIDATLSEQVASLTTQLAESDKKREAIEVQLKEKEFEMDFGERLQKGTALPKMKDWAKQMYLRDVEEYTSVMETMPVIVDLSERGTSAGNDQDAMTKFTELVRQTQEEKKINFSDAMQIVARENPQLAAEYQDAARGR